MIKAEHFERELNLIVNEDLRMAVKTYLQQFLPQLFVRFANLIFPAIRCIIMPRGEDNVKN